jgi:RNA recognition motif-containing protein
MANIFVGNIGANCTEVLIRSVFEAYGQVADVSLTSNCAVIQMPNDSEADEAIRDLSDTAWYLTPLVSTGARELLWSRFHSH